MFRCISGGAANFARPASRGSRLLSFPRTRPQRAHYSSVSDLTGALNNVGQVINANNTSSWGRLLELRYNHPELRSSLTNLQNVYRDTIGHNYHVHYETSFTKEPVTVAVTGAAGAIGYATIFRIASGQMLGVDQPVNLHLLELPQAASALGGVVMELQDCAFPLVNKIVATTEASVAFHGAQYALLIGAKPRSKGMERKDLLQENAKIFKAQGEALNLHADRGSVKVLVVGNPANTNALIAADNAPSLNPRQFTAMTRLDHNRGVSQLAEKTGASVHEIERFAIWGNHSATQYPDISHCQIRGKWAKSVINDDDWVTKTFIPAVQQRGAAVINARGSSSAASAANAAIEHIRLWAGGSRDQWTSMGVYSEGEYGTTSGIYYSFPVICSDNTYTVVQNVPIDPFSASRLQATHKELLEEREAVKDYLPTIHYINVAKKAVEKAQVRHQEQIAELEKLRDQVLSGKLSRVQAEKLLLEKKVKTVTPEIKARLLKIHQEFKEKCPHLITDRILRLVGNQPKPTKPPSLAQLYRWLPLSERKQFRRLVRVKPTGSQKPPQPQTQQQK